MNEPTTPIAGIGVDLVHIGAFAEQLAETGTRFADVFTPTEKRAATRRAEASSGAVETHLAARWAAKEAFIKAWSDTRHGLPDLIRPEHLDWSQIELRGDVWGRPRLVLRGAVKEAFGSMSARVSLTHDTQADAACAFVVVQEAS